MPSPRSAGIASRPMSRREFVLGTAGALALGGLAAACGSGTGTSPLPTLAPAGNPKRGGDFRLGVTGGGSSDMFDAQNFVTRPDQARLVSAFETLLVFDDDYVVTNGGLAEEVSQDSATQWTVRLHKGIEFQDGKTLGAEDVCYSLRRILDSKNGLPGYSQLMAIDPGRLEVMDPRTVRLHLRTPNAVLDQGLAAFNNTIVPVGYEKFPAKQVGTGPYALETFTPGEASVSRRNPNYWRAPEPWFDSVTITDFPEATAQVDALLSDQIDAMTDLPAAQVSVVSGRGLGVLVSHTGEWIPLCMRVDVPPFDNPDLRMAMRLIVDRPQTVAQVTSDYGRIANDLFAPFDPDYDSSLPQRVQDIDQAKYLLRRAGMENGSLTLHTTNGAEGMVELASVFAAQAQSAGLQISVLNDPNFYGNQYLKLAFCVDFWGTRDYLAQVSQGMLPTSAWNETHWPPKAGPAAGYVHLYNEALSTLDAALRKDLIHEMQRLEYDYGGYVIAYFADLIDGYSNKLHGLQPSRGTLNLDQYGHGFRTIWFA